jgi:murein tripeptide amidase MpaA
MLNPDGVVNGNYRCNLVGCDLNRRWPNPSKLLHPTIYFTKKLIAGCHQENQVVLFCDFHGHSRKCNVFMYGCNAGESMINQHKNNNLIKIVPYFLSQKNKLF